MQDLSHASISKLLQADNAEPKVTIYIPMHDTASPPHMTENQIRFKNLLNKAADELQKRQEKVLASTLRQQIDTQMKDLEFWESQTQGLLLCASPSELQLFHLPVDTEEYVAIDSCYHLAPILALLGDEQSFYVLTIAQQQPKLFAGSMYGLCEMEVDMPTSLEASLNIDEQGQKREQAQAMGQGVAFNGRGGRRDPAQEERLRFFRIVDEIVANATERNLPLVLTGTDSEISEYRSISKHPHIMKRSISGSFSGAKAHDLFDQAYAIIYDDLVAVRRQAAVQHYGQMKGTRKEQVSEDPLTIAEAARQGRIDTLLVALKRSTADTVRDTKRVVERITFPSQELSELINKTASAVAKARGQVINIEASPQHSSSVMALLRY